ncbi:MAG: hypothetical protein M3O01_01325 [Pseudomonadota bacterium]|nr:hypothetical protein [Pseudomonadota bacterium]
MTTTRAPTNTEALRQDLLSAVDALQRRRADQISEGQIAAFIALYWMEWNGGSLQLTQTGKNVCEQVRAAARQA